MQKVLVAGATGYLGSHVVRELKKRGYYVRALARNPKKLTSIQDSIDEVFTGEVTKPESLEGACKNIDVLFSSIGITRQQDGLSYMDVDYQGNKNLLECAQANGVSKFIYTSVFNAEKMKQLNPIHAKIKFSDELRASGMNYAIVNPNGFFSDIEQYFEMAKFGVAFLIGDGTAKINPIHGEDLAKVCVDAIQKDEKQIDVGGPEIFTHREILELAFKALHKHPLIIQVPQWTVDLTAGTLKLFATENIYSPIEFAILALTLDMVAPAYGEKKLGDFFAELAQKA
ncbi:NAD-dependent epimerase/dehydratase [Chloroherpeton thalassium ATCC 35110]|uniref:NAD-dependent epimerase/dehydratase n=1 Tax=Chloroherpeton thalassium (strain ATCC 35110 / GB-78) TaxID=517418 RepID=B3QVM4_CHLT3|nr:SDR family oxidoreductase [Chloroherpeton thalassium]ACF13081.1 NAD-dependent epimerase/dehydratase [Chloroherpeton thalassium ATCC 35110]